MGKFLTKETGLLSSSVQRPAAERLVRSESLSRQTTDRSSTDGPFSFPSMSERRRDQSPRPERSRSFCCLRGFSNSSRVYKSMETISPTLERQYSDRFRNVDSSHGENTGYKINQNMRQQKETLQGSKEYFEGEHPRGRQYIISDDMKGKEFCKHSRSRENKYIKLYPNKSSGKDEGKKICQERERQDESRTKNNVSKICSEVETQEVARPSLTAVRTSTFRIRLYHQLNVVERSSKKLSYLDQSPFNARGLSSSFARPNRCLGKERTGDVQFERSKPIAMDTGRINDNDVGDHDQKWPEGFKSRPQASDIEDVFDLDIEPT